MSQKDTDKHLAHSDMQSPAIQFFREEAIGVLGLGKHVTISEQELPQSAKHVIPALPQYTPAGERETNSYWRHLRNFFRSGVGGGIHDKEKDSKLYPLLLAPYRDHSFWPGHYPFWVADALSIVSESGEPFLPVMDLIKKSIQAFAPQESAARILKDNLSRLERILRKKVAFADIAYQALPVLEESLQDLIAELNISGTEGQTLVQDVNRLKSTLPRLGVLVPGGPMAPFHLLAAFLETFHRKERANFREEVSMLIARLNEMLSVEKGKRPDAQSSDHLHDTLDFADNFLNFEELSSVLPATSSDTMPEERFSRIEKILESLRNAEREFIAKGATLLVDPELDNPAWKESFSNNTLYPAKPEGLCQQAMKLYDERMGAYAHIFAAVRLAKLELEGNYRPELHGDFFAHFDWRSFNRQELAFCPPVFLLVDESILLNKELNDFSQLLASDRHIKLFVLRRTVHPKNRENEETPQEHLMLKRELGALAIAHRNVCVVQTTIVDPVSLLEGLREGLAASSPVLFNVFAPADHPQSYFLLTSAAVESRFFPSFSYNSEKGPRWGSRFNIGQNPQVELDWPEHTVSIKEKGEQTKTWRLPFTFADFVAQDPDFGDHFLRVPPEYWQDNLIPLSEYLQLQPDIAFDKAPFIWMIDEQGIVQKVAVAWPLVLSCRERMDFWRYLQENAGIHSYHVERATEKLKREIEEQYEQEKAVARERHQKEISKAVEEAARGAMERLAATLLEMDPDINLVGVTQAAPPKVEKAKLEEPQAKPEQAVKKEEGKPKVDTNKKEEEVALPPGEAWIDTPLCTSCNECIDLNKKIFQYNEDKQAFVADPKGGPFADIVKAAENCPVKIIHPGAPQDPGELGLKELIKRAQPFN